MCNMYKFYIFIKYFFLINIDEYCYIDWYIKKYPYNLIKFYNLIIK